MIKIIIFFFENTLINKRRKVPKQTFHLLKKLKRIGYYIGIISNNPMIYFDAIEFELYKYSNFIKCDNTIKIENLFNLILTLLKNKYLSNDDNNAIKIYYIDNNIDNLQKIKSCNTDIKLINCIDLYTLYKIIDKKNINNSIEDNLLSNSMNKNYLLN